MVCCFCPCLYYRSKIFPTDEAFIQITAGQYSTNMILTPEEIDLVQQVAKIITESMFEYVQKGCCSRTCSMWFCPTSVDKLRADNIRQLTSLKFGEPELQFGQYNIHMVRFRLNRDIIPATESVTMSYSRGEWTYNGVPNVKSLQLRDEINKTLFPQPGCCLYSLEKFWPDSCIGCIIYFLSPCNAPCAVNQSISYIVSHITSPCWSCCSALRYKDEWKSDPNIYRSTILLTTTRVGVNCPGYRYKT